MHIDFYKLFRSKYDFLPIHLRKYVVEQDYEKYTPVDQAVWRYILRQLRSFLSVNAHEAYLEGLKKTGIDVEMIPVIEDVSEHLKKFGWRALPVSGFIPPAAFMELQSLGILPIASDMRSMEHLLYTPAPDIVHEAAGHAPMLIHPEFSEYLRRYAMIAKKAIISREDLDVYEAIRSLSDIKENPSSTPEQIRAAEARLANVSQSVTHISEAALLARMNWWTAEYGLIGDLRQPKIFGAGLLSSIAESKSCMTDKVKKIALSIDCINKGYDITEQQPQLYVTPDFKTLVGVLDELAGQMAFFKGGTEGLNKAIKARSVNTAELNSGIQVSGQITEALIGTDGQIAYLSLHGPSQLSFHDQELPRHGKKYHSEGFGTPLGFLKSHPDKCLSTFTHQDWTNEGIEIGKVARLEFTSGVVVSGTIQNRLTREGKTLIITWVNALVEYQGRVLFAPEWGFFDMAVGSAVSSVFGGPADRQAYGETVDFIARRVSQPEYTDLEMVRHSNFQLLRSAREMLLSGSALKKELEAAVIAHKKFFPEDWLFLLEAYELMLARLPYYQFTGQLEKDLRELANKNEKFKELIEAGMTIAGVLE